MDIDQELLNKILKQIEDTYPDSINSNNDILPEMKSPEEREKIRKHLLILKDRGKVIFRESGGSKDSPPMHFGIRLVP